MSVRALTLLLAVGLLAVVPARADHEADHRYTVRGYVLDADEQPREGERVRVSGDGRTLGSARVQEDGFYSVQMHLHDEDLGRELTVRVGDSSATIRMQGDAGDTHTERVHYASFVGERFSEDDLGRFRMPGWGWALLGLGGIVLVAAAGDRVQRRRKRQRIAAAKAQGRGRAPRSGKRRRR